MICCERCFNDKEIKSMIRNFGNKGVCNYCSGENVLIYDTEKNNELTELFNELIDVYTSVEKIDNYPEEKHSLITDILSDIWHIFSISKEQSYRLVKEICKESYSFDPKIFTQPVGIRELVDQSYLVDHAILKKKSWNNFSQEIKNNNRFHTDHINKNVLKEYCKFATISIKKDSIFYRSRIAEDNYFEKEDMGAPPFKVATGGRANPVGIPYLYLSTNEMTSISETRARANDNLTVAKFSLKQDINLVNFNDIDKLSPFSQHINDLTELAINKETLKKIGEEISKPLRKNDAVLEYIPTQYICDYIKSQGDLFQGIQYKSTVNDKGLNIAVFDEKLFECVEVKNISIGKIKYDDYCDEV